MWYFSMLQCHKQQELKIHFRAKKEPKNWVNSCTLYICYAFSFNIFFRKLLYWYLLKKSFYQVYREDVEKNIFLRKTAGFAKRRSTIIGCTIHQWYWYLFGKAWTDRSNKWSQKYSGLFMSLYCCSSGKVRWKFYEQVIVFVRSHLLRKRITWARSKIVIFNDLHPYLDNHCWIRLTVL